MIGKLKGRVDSTSDDSLIVDVGGVGYVVFASIRTLSRYASAGEAVELVIETHVREDHIHLYGFTSVVERDWFRLLTTVQGVGARLALAILGQFTPDQLSNAIAAQDKKLITATPGVGPKLAERMITELKSKVGSLPTSAMVLSHPAHSKAAKADTAPPQVTDDAVSALVHLGYGRSEAYAAVARVASQHGEPSIDDLIRLSLRELAS
jgi:Holliday junction DNA helicase RuvA